MFSYYCNEDTFIINYAHTEFYYEFFHINKALNNKLSLRFSNNKLNNTLELLNIILEFYNNNKLNEENVDNLNKLLGWVNKSLPLNDKFHFTKDLFV